MPRILAFSGSARGGSLNRRVLNHAIHGAREAGAEVTLLELGELPLPLYDGDLEASEGLPANVVRIKSLFASHGGLLIASPEYNSSISPLLKNVIDWVSRSGPGEAPLASFRGKTAALLSASPGHYGGLRGLYHLREILQNIGVTVLPDPHVVALPKAHEALDTEGAMTHGRHREQVEGVGRRLAEALRG